MNLLVVAAGQVFVLRQLVWRDARHCAGLQRCGNGLPLKAFPGQSAASPAGRVR